jgi:hypothetical protein
MSPPMPRPLTEEQIAELWALFGSPPVLSTENQQAYDKIRAEYVSYYRPTNTLQVRLVREVVDTEWEMSRFIRHRSVGIERSFRRHIENYVTRLRCENLNRRQEAHHLAKHRPGDVAQLARLQTVISQTQSDIEEILKCEPAEMDHNRALQQGAVFLDQLDKWLNTATVRRNNALKLLEYYCGDPGDRSEVIETEYKEIEQGKIEHMSSPPLAPPEVVANDIATQNHSESVELSKE